MDVTLKIAIISAIALIIGALIKLLGDLISKGSSGGLVFTLIVVILALLGGGAFVLFWQMPTQTPHENIFTQNFDGSEGSFDTNVWTCSAGSCNAQNVFQRNGTLVFMFNTSEISSDTWGAYIVAQSRLKMENPISLEGKLQISKNTKGGTWLGITWLGVDVGSACAIFSISSVDIPSIHCDIGSNEKEYTTADIPVEFDTWYLIRIDYDPITQEQKFYINNEFIGQHTTKNLPELASVVLGAWREENQSVNAFIDNVVVKTRP